MTAILTIEQLKSVVEILNSETPAILSIFAGRIADTGIDPVKTVSEAVKIAQSKPLASILWASTRQVYSIFDAEKAGCQIITVPHDIIKKFAGLGKDLEQLSLETVKMFYEDAKQAGYKIETNDK